MHTLHLRLLYYTFAVVNILVTPLIRRLPSLSIAASRYSYKPRTMATLIDGNATAAQIRNELKAKVQELQEVYGVTPGLAVILVGSRTDSATYVRSKKKACAETGINSYGFDYGEDVTQEELLAKVHELNAG
jgi:hypothetical protein